MTTWENFQITLQGVVMMSEKESTSAKGRRRKIRALIGFAVAGAMLVSACGGSSSSSPDTTGAATEDTIAAPTGTPLKVMVLTPINSPISSYPNIAKAAEIYQQWVNDRGGIAGHPLEVTICDDKADPNESAACGRKAVAEKHIAIVGSFTLDVSSLMPILEENSIPWFGACCPVSAIEFTSPMSFVMGSVFSLFMTGGKKMVEDGCKNPAVIVGDIASADYYIGQAKLGFTSMGFDPEKAVYIKLPLGATDLTAQAAQATKGTDCIFGPIGDIQWLSFLPAFNSVGGTQRLYGAQGNLNGKVAEAFPTETENGIVINSYPNLVSPAWDDYRAALVQYKAPDLDWNSLAGLGTWAAFHAFNKIVTGMTGEINNVTFAAAATATSNLKMDGMTIDLDFTKPWTALKGGVPRIINRTVYYDIIKGGKLTPEDNNTAHDMTSVYGK